MIENKIKLLSNKFGFILDKHLNVNFEFSDLIKLDSKLVNKIKQKIELQNISVKLFNQHIFIPNKESIKLCIFASFRTIIRKINRLLMEKQLKFEEL